MPAVTATVTLRVPAELMPDVDRLAEWEGLSRNAWLVRAVEAAVARGASRDPKDVREAVERHAGQPEGAPEAMADWQPEADADVVHEQRQRPARPFQGSYDPFKKR